MNKIHFHELGIRSLLLQRRLLKKFLFFLFRNEKTRLDRVDIIFCSDDYLFSLNKEFLNHDYLTDTLSFVLSNPNEPITGELYLSIDRIRVNALAFRVPYQDELIRVIIHSCLHLCGYLDNPAKNNIKMVKKQESYLRKWNVPRET